MCQNRSCGKSLKEKKRNAEKVLDKKIIQNQQTWANENDWVKEERERDIKKKQRETDRYNYNTSSTFLKEVFWERHIKRGRDRENEREREREAM